MPNNLNKHKINEPVYISSGILCSMKMFDDRYFRFLGIIFFLVSTLSAQVMIHKNLNIEDGMVYSQVLSIHEDLSGYMWFGTSSGLSRWDGVSFKNYIFPSGLPDNNCKWIAEFSDSTLFFATGKSVVKYKKGIFSPIPNTSPAMENWIHSMMVSGDDKLFIATDTSGVWIYDGAGFRNINKREGLKSNSARALARGSNGTMYIADKTGTIYTFSGSKLSRIKIPGFPADVIVSALYRDSEEALWIGTRTRGVFVFYRGNLLHFTLKDGLPGKKVTFLSVGDANQVFVATDNGLAIFENYRLHLVLDKKAGLSNSFIWQVFRDHNGLYYIATDGGGVDIYRPGLFQTINTDCGLPHNTVWAVCETANHDFYFGTDEGLALYSKNDISVYDSTSGLSSNMVLALHEGSDGTLYVGTNETGVDMIRNGKITNVNYKQGLDGPSVWTITEDRDGLIYFGTYDGGVNVWNGSRVIDTLNTADGFPSNAIVSSYRSSDGSLFFGTDGSGVFRLRQGRMDTLLLKGNTVWSIYADKQNNFYFGTNDRGMIYFRNGKWDTLDISDGLSHNSILGILQDAREKFYLTADNGLNVVDFSGDQTLVRRIGSRDGLAGDECNQGAYFKDSQGYLWFGTINGLSRYNPSLAKPNRNAPIIHLTRFQVYDRDLPVDERKTERVFPYDQNYFKFEFIGIDLLAPYKVIYQYRLSGLDQEWVTTKRPYVQYTSLDDGSYTFQAKAGNEWGYWSEPISLSFKIKPPFWRTWWFLLLAFLVIVSPVAVVVRQRISRLFAVERLRSKIAADLHDDIGAGLSEINILSAVVAAKTPPEIKSVYENELNKIGHTARSLIEQMSDIVWLVNPQKDAVSDLVTRLSDSFADVFEAKDIRFRCENSEELRHARLKMEYRQHLFLILKEAIHNAIKYSKANQVILIVSLTNKKLNIRVQDNGVCFDTGCKTTGNGLRNMKERATKIGGLMEIRSKEGEGTIVEFQGKLK